MKIRPVFHVSKLKLWHDDTEHADRMVYKADVAAHRDYVSDAFLVHAILDVKIANHQMYQKGKALLLGYVGKVAVPKMTLGNRMFR
jgi:hypothetical protein